MTLSDDRFPSKPPRTLTEPLERVGETLRATLESLAVVAPEWLRAQALPEWYDRYGSRVENYHLPKADSARQEWAERVGADGHRLLQAIDEATKMTWLKEIPAVKILRRLWIEQYLPENGRLGDDRNDLDHLCCFSQGSDMSLVDDDLKPVVVVPIGCCGLRQSH